MHQSLLSNLRTFPFLEKNAVSWPPCFLHVLHCSLSQRSPCGHWSIVCVIIRCKPSLLLESAALWGPGLQCLLQGLAPRRSQQITWRRMSEWVNGDGRLTAHPQVVHALAESFLSSSVLSHRLFIPSVSATPDLARGPSYQQFWMSYLHPGSLPGPSSCGLTQILLSW